MHEWPGVPNHRYYLAIFAEPVRGCFNGDQLFSPEFYPVESAIKIPRARTFMENTPYNFLIIFDLNGHSAYVACEQIEFHGIVAEEGEVIPCFMAKGQWFFSANDNYIYL